jgi:hypothetical protein
MKKTLSLLSLAAMSVALHAQTTTSPQRPDPTMTPGTTQTGSQPTATTDVQTPQASQRAAQVQAASVSAELTKGIDTKRAKVGDEVNAKTMSEAKLPDGTVLPKGTKLVGNVVDVTAKTKEQKNAHLVIGLNRAVLKDGHDVPIHAAVTSVTAPVAASDTATLPSGGGAVSSGGDSSGGSGGAAGSGSAAQSASTMAGSVTSQSQSTTGAMLKSANDRVAVGNMPNVILSAPSTPESAGILDGAGQNFALQSGTKLTVNIAPAAQGG